jgi:TetR/AcrR family transcriptional regulator
MPRPASDIDSRLVQAARRCFLSRGVDGSSLRDIAAAAGTSIGMIYYHFGTKDDLFFAVVEDVYRRLLADLETALAPGPPVVDRLRALYRRLARLTDGEVEVVRLVLGEALVSSARLDRLVARFLRGHLPLVLGLLREGVRDGTLDGRRPTLLLMMATFALAGPPQLIRRTIRGRLPGAAGLPAGEALADELLEILLGGVAGGRPRRRAGRRPVRPRRARSE